MFRKILVPVDFTRKNMEAIDQACRMGGPESSEVVLLHVIEEVSGVPFMELRKFYKGLETRASKEIAVLERRVQRRHRHVQSAIEIGRRSDAIVRYAREHGVDLIVMSSHRMRGKTPHPSSWATISHVVAALAPCSTLLVK